MPGLVAFDRRWHIGSDDLFFPAAIGLVIRFCWYVILKGSESLTFATLFSLRTSSNSYGIYINRKILFGPLSAHTIPYISSQRRDSKPSNFAILKSSAFQNKWSAV